MQIQKKQLPLNLWIVSCLVIGIIVFSLFSGYLAPYDPYETNPQLIQAAPSMEHWFGTDSHGRDILSRILVGAKTSIFASFAIIIGATAIGTSIGLICGYYGGRIDAWLMRVTDVFLGIPNLIFAVAVAGVMGGGLINAMLALLVTTWTQYARLSRGLVIGVKDEVFISAARLSGCSDWQILFKHILPNIGGTLIVTAVLHISIIMMGLAGLSFLGLGVKVPEAEWGTMISDGLSCLSTAPWVALIPSAIMVLVLMVFNLLGDQLRDILDPKQMP